MFASLAAVLACGAPAAHAATTGGASADVENAGPQIIVTGQRGRYGASSTGTATKTNTDVKDIPQALTSISSAQIDDQQLRSMGQLLTFVPGASAGTGEGNRDQLVLRGNSSTADFFVDGVRDDVQYFRDFYNVERVEILKGPNAMIFGRGGGGGIVNRVLKRPTFSDRRDVTASADSFGDVRGTVDVDAALRANAGARITAMAEDGRGFRKHTRLRRWGVNPTAAATIGETRIDLSFEHFHDRRTADRGVPANGDEPLRGFDRTFFGDPDKSHARANVDLASLAVQQQLGTGLTLRNRTLLGSYRKFYQNVYPTAFSASSGLVTLGAYNNRNDRDNLFSQTDLVWANRLAGIDQTLLVGFEVGRQKSRNQRLSGTIVSGNTTPISDPTVDVDVIWAAAPTDANNRARASVAAVYVQDQIRLGKAIEIVAGVRFDSFKLRVRDLRTSGGEFTRSDHLVSPRLGLVLKPAGSLSFYSTYSRSYLPQSGDQFSGLTPVTDSLKPERFDNYEIGAKWEPKPGLLATAAIYRLDRSNTQARDQNDQVVLTGAQRSRGVELGLERSLASGWLISAGYAWQKAEIVKTTAAAPAGREVPLVPRNSASLWSRYDLNRHLGIGVGVVARSKSYATISNAVTLPGYARLDGALFYEVGNGIEAQVNVENLLGAHYFSAANSDNNIAPGAPRTVKASLGYRF
ncbi:catecholate siderophore receptor [Sphingomonas sp. F9_3S_D5_B_2]